MKKWTSINFNLVYYDITPLILQADIKIHDYNKDNLLTKKDILKLAYHFVLTGIIDTFKNNHNKKVLYLNKGNYSTFTYIDLKKLLKMLTSSVFIPIIELDSDDVFIKNNGGLKELDNKFNQYYLSKRPSSKKLRRMLEVQNFYCLTSNLKDVNNIKLLFN